jgi:uncharacterized protein (DUF305 family)
MRHHPTRALGGLIVVLALLGTACGSADTATETTAEVSTTEHNASDVAFATDMIQHHAQALLMVDLTLGRPMGEEVHGLAEEIRAAQGPEIEAMARWLTDWDEDIPETVRDHANADKPMDEMDHGDGDMPGMMSAEDMSALKAVPDDQFEQMWLEMMIEHHEGAIEMAEEQVKDGRYQAAVEMASEIVVSQTAEIEMMRDLL